MGEAQIVKEVDQNGIYSIDGERMTFMKIKLKSKASDAKSFKVQIRVTNVAVIRLKKLETLFLEELSWALFDSNKAYNEEIIKGILKQAEEKAKKKTQKN